MTKEELAEKYADETVISNLKETIKDAFQKGYDTAKLEFAKVITAGDIDYIDLGLPSGTCWSFPVSYCDYGTHLRFISYQEAQNLNIPTLEQWKELVAHCEFMHEKIIGPNSARCGYRWAGAYNDYIIYELGEGCEEERNHFWLKATPDANHKVDVIEYDKDGSHATGKHFTGFRLPYFLVINKKDL